MADQIRAALERLVAAERFIGEAAPEYQQAHDAARAALAFASPQPVVAPKNDSCPGCEGSPSTSNNPCAVCGAIRPQEFQ